MGENSCMIRVGRLLEIRVKRGFPQVADVDEQYRELLEIFNGLPPKGQVVIAADWRACPVMSPEAATELTRILNAVVPRVERSAVLGLDDSPTRLLQFFRVIREGGHPERKFFTGVDPMLTFLDERLTPPESARVREFLKEG